MTARARLILYLAAFFIGLIGVQALHRQGEKMQTADYAAILIDYGLAEAGEGE